MKNQSKLVHRTLPKSQQRTSMDSIDMNRQPVCRTRSRHASKCILLGRASLSSGTPWIASSLTECYFVALFSCYSINLHTMFLLIYFCLDSLTSLHQHGTHGQPGEESLITEQSRSTLWESTCTCIQGDSQSSFPVKCWNFQPSLQVECWR